MLTHPLTTQRVVSRPTGWASLRPCQPSRGRVYRHVRPAAAADAQRSSASFSGDGSTGKAYQPQDRSIGANPLAPAVGLVLQVAGHQQLRSWSPAVLLQWTRACAATGYRVPTSAASALVAALLAAAPSLTSRGACQLLAALDTISLHSQFLSTPTTACSVATTTPSSNGGSSSTAASGSNQQQQQQPGGVPPAQAVAPQSEELPACWLRLLQALYISSMAIGQQVGPGGLDRSTALDLAAGLEGAAHLAAAAASASAAAAAAAVPGGQLSMLTTTSSSSGSGTDTPSGSSTSSTTTTTSSCIDSMLQQPLAGLPFLGPSAAPTGVVLHSWCTALAAGDGAGLQHLPPQQLVAVASSLQKLVQLQQPGSPLELALQWVETGSTGGSGAGSTSLLPPGFLACYCGVVAQKLAQIPADSLQELATVLPQLLQRFELSQPSMRASPAGLSLEDLLAPPSSPAAAAAGESGSSRAEATASSSSSSGGSLTSSYGSASQEVVACRQLLVAGLQRQLPSLSSLQLCELLPLVCAADLAMPSSWVEQVTARLATGLATLSCPGATRALLALVSLQAAPPESWSKQYVDLLKTGFLELTPEQLVAALRALRTLDALPSAAWLQDITDGVERRWGFIGPVELVRSGFLLANLGHMVSSRWGNKFLHETLRFCSYYGGEMITHVVWCVVKLRLQPSSEWLAAYAQQLQTQVQGFLPYQLAFSLGSLQQLGAPLSSSCIDAALEAFGKQLRAAEPADAVLMLVTVARLRHISSYSWLQAVLDYLQPHLKELNGQEVVTVLWSLVQVHHTPDEEFLQQLTEAAGEQLLTMTPTQAAELLYSVALLDAAPDEAWLRQWCTMFQAALRAGAATGRDVASALSSLAALGHTPSDTWLQDALQLLHFKLREVEPAGLASVPRSLVKLHVTVLEGPWLEHFTSMLLPALPRLSGSDKADLITAYATWGVCPPPAWMAAFQLSCIAAAEAGGMTPLELEQVVVAVCSLGAAPSTALLQLWYDSSAGQLNSWAPERLVTILAALRKAQVTPGGSWLQRVVEQVQEGMQGYTLPQLNSLLKSLMAFEAAGASKQQQAYLSNLISRLKEFFLYGGA